MSSSQLSDVSLRKYNTLNYNISPDATTIQAINDANKKKYRNDKNDKGLHNLIGVTRVQATMMARLKRTESRNGFQERENNKKREREREREREASFGEIKRELIGAKRADLYRAHPRSSRIAEGLARSSFLHLVISLLLS